MAEATATAAPAVSEHEADLRVYEAGYHISPSIKEEELETVIGAIRARIESVGGKFLAEGAPSLMKLAYSMDVKEHGKRVEYDRGYFGWLKFEAPPAAARELEQFLLGDERVMRGIVFKTVREDTRAHMRAPSLREVKRTDTLKLSPRRPEEAAAPVSEADLEKALKDITTE